MLVTKPDSVPFLTMNVDDVSMLKGTTSSSDYADETPAMVRAAKQRWREAKSKSRALRILVWMAPVVWFFFKLSWLIVMSMSLSDEMGRLEALKNDVSQLNAETRELRGLRTEMQAAVRDVKAESARATSVLIDAEKLSENALNETRTVQERSEVQERRFQAAVEQFDARAFNVVDSRISLHLEQVRLEIVTQTCKGTGVPNVHTSCACPDSYALVGGGSSCYPDAPRIPARFPPDVSVPKENATEFVGGCLIDHHDPKNPDTVFIGADVVIICARVRS